MYGIQNGWMIIVISGCEKQCHYNLLSIEITKTSKNIFNSHFDLKIESPNNFLFCFLHKYSFIKLIYKDEFKS